MSPWEATVDREIWWKVRGDGGLKHNHHKGRNARLRTTIKWIDGNAHITTHKKIVKDGILDRITNHGIPITKYQQKQPPQYE